MGPDMGLWETILRRKIYFATPRAISVVAPWVGNRSTCWTPLILHFNNSEATSARFHWGRYPRHRLQSYSFLGQARNRNIREPSSTTRKQRTQLHVPFRQTSTRAGVPERNSMLTTNISGRQWNGQQLSHIRASPSSPRG